MATVSVVVPCYNEAENVEAMHKAVTTVLAGAHAEYEIIFVDDGSPDSTFAVASRVSECEPRVRVISVSRNFGKEAAILAGLRAADGDVVVLMDGDLQHPPELILSMLGALDEGFDQVVAKRNRTGDPWLRTLFSRAYYRCVDRLVDVDLEDGVGDFRALSRKAVDAVLSLGEVTRFSKGLFAWVGFPTKTIPYDNVVRATGGSTWTMGRLFNYGLDGAISFNNKPLRVVIWLGFTVVLMTILYLVWLVGTVIFGGVEVPGYVTLVALVTGIGGVQLVCLGVIGEYIGRVYVETKQRPHYVVSHSIGSRLEP